MQRTPLIHMFANSCSYVRGAPCPTLHANANAFPRPLRSRCRRGGFIRKAP
jgi:hypothetical protein